MIIPNGCDVRSMDEEQLKALIRNKVREESFKELNDMQANHKEGKCIYKET